MPADAKPTIISEIPKTYLALGIVVGIFVAGVSSRDKLKALFLNDAKATSEQSNRDKGQDELLQELRLEQTAQSAEIQNLKRGMEWGNDRLFELATKERLDPPPTPSPLPVPRPR